MKKLLHRIAGIVQIGGGFIGMSQILPTLTSFDANNFQSVLAAIFFVLFLFALIAGVLLLEGHAKAVFWSLWVQVLQIPFISFPFFAYKFIAGFDINLHWIGQQGGLNYQFGSNWMLAINGSNTWGIGINLFALIIFILLWRVRGGK